MFVIGMLEMVTEASTLRAIQTEHGLTGSFKDKPLNEWLMRHNPTDMLYKAVYWCFCSTVHVQNLFLYVYPGCG